MPVYNTVTLIQNLQEQTENHLQIAVHDFQVLSPVHLLHQPEPGKWSAAQCLQHLNAYGKYYLPAIETSIQANLQKHQPAEQFVSGMLGNYFTKLILPKGEAGSITKMSAPKNYRPSGALDAHAVVAEFIDQQEKTLKLLDAAHQVNLTRAKTPISISKWIRLRLGDTFFFVIAHNYRHVLQAQRALATAGVQNQLKARLLQP